MFPRILIKLDFTKSPLRKQLPLICIKHASLELALVTKISIVFNCVIFIKTL